MVILRSSQYLQWALLLCLIGIPLSHSYAEQGSGLTLERIHCDPSRLFSSCIYLGKIVLSNSSLQELMRDLDQQCDKVKYPVCISEIYYPKYSPTQAEGFQGSAWELKFTDKGAVRSRVFQEMSSYLRGRTDQYIRVVATRKFVWASGVNVRSMDKISLFFGNNRDSEDLFGACPFNLYTVIPGMKVLESGVRAPGLRHLFIVRSGHSARTLPIAAKASECLQRLVDGEDVYVVFSGTTTNVFSPPFPLLIPEFLGEPIVMGEQSGDEFICLRDPDIDACQLAPHFFIHKKGSIKP